MDVFAKGKRFHVIDQAAGDTLGRDGKVRDRNGKVLKGAWVDAGRAAQWEADGLLEDAPEPKKPSKKKKAAEEPVDDQGVEDGNSN